jgi:hypothetical protein
MSLDDAAMMYAAAIERDRQEWQRACMIAQAMGAEISVDKLYEMPAAKRERRLDKLEHYRRTTRGFADWINRLN